MTNQEKENQIRTIRQMYDTNESELSQGKRSLEEYNETGIQITKMVDNLEREVGIVIGEAQ